LILILDSVDLIAVVKMLSFFWPLGSAGS
jgi:hypothetical protein